MMISSERLWLETMLFVDGDREDQHKDRQTQNGDQQYPFE